MPLFLIEAKPKKSGRNPWSATWRTRHAGIVRAKNKNEARRIFQNDEVYPSFAGVWLSEDLSPCTLLDPLGESGVLLTHWKGG